MTRIYPEQLKAQLESGLRPYYLLSGNEPLLLMESQDMICQTAVKQSFEERLTFNLDNQTDWPELFHYCQEFGLFSNRKILILHCGESGITAPISEKLNQLITMLHDDILLILQVNKLSKAQENSTWFKAFNSGSYIICQTPEHAQLPRWLAQRAKHLNLQLDEQVIQLLCYSYEGNLLALSQVLEHLLLLYPDGKLTLPRVEQVVNNVAHFMPYHWLDALLSAKAKRAMHILQQLEKEDTEALILVRSLQKELLQLLTLQKQMSTTPLKVLFDQHKVWQNRRPVLTQALQRLTFAQLKQALALLTQIELQLKHDFSYSVWAQLESLTLLLCGKPLIENIDG